MAGEPITTGSQRAITVRPNEIQSRKLIAPIHEDAGEPVEEDENEKEVVETDISKHKEGQADWEQISEKSGGVEH